MMENIVVVGIVALVAAWAGRSLYRTLTGKNDGCGCDASKCGACPSRKKTWVPGKGAKERP